MTFNQPRDDETICMLPDGQIRSYGGASWPPKTTHLKPLQMSVALFRAILANASSYAGWVEFTPELCGVILANNPDNRPLSEKIVLARYTRHMAEGHWQCNGMPIVIAVTGELNDGQHRLLACVNVGKPFVALLVMGVPRDTRGTVDIGKPKSIADHLMMADQQRKAPGSLAQAARLIVEYYRYQTMVRRPELDPSSPDIIEFVAANPSIETDEWYLARATKLREVVGLSAGAGMALLWIFGHLDGGREAAEEFTGKLINGTCLEKGDPEFLLRERLLRDRGSKKKMKKEEIYALVIKAWNAFRTGRKMTSQGLAWASNTKSKRTPEAFPIAI
jgi:hypothetical protein